MAKGIKLMNAIGKAMDESIQTSAKKANGTMTKPSKTQTKSEDLKDTSQDFHVENPKGSPSEKIKKS